MVDGVESGRKIKEAKTRQLLWSWIYSRAVSVEWCLQ